MDVVGGGRATGSAGPFIDLQSSRRPIDARCPNSAWHNSQPRLLSIRRHVKHVLLEAISPRYLLSPHFICSGVPTHVAGRDQRGSLSWQRREMRNRGEAKHFIAARGTDSCGVLPRVPWRGTLMVGLYISDNLTIPRLLVALLPMSSVCRADTRLPFQDSSAMTWMSLPRNATVQNGLLTSEYILHFLLQPQIWRFNPPPKIWSRVQSFKRHCAPIWGYQRPGLLRRHRGGCLC